eukprot:4269513-Pleurochrysis_carterae.AAC.2
MGHVNGACFLKKELSKSFISLGAIRQLHGKDRNQKYEFKGTLWAEDWLHAGEGPHKEFTSVCAAKM